MMGLERLFHLMSEEEASDLYLSVGSPITIKINGVCVPINQERLAPQAVVSLLAERLTDAQFRELEETKALNIGLPVQGEGSFRLSAFLQRGSVSAVVRYIPHEVPRLDSLLLPDILKTLVMSIGVSNALGKAWGGHGTRVRARMRRLRQHGVSGLGADALAWVGFGRPVTLHKGGSLPRPRG